MHKEKQYDLLVVGSGLYGAVVAYRAHKAGKRVLVVEARKEVGGNIRCENRDGINIHIYGPHIFHTSNREVWEFAKQFVRFNDFINSPIALYRGEKYPLPFNLNTFRALWGVDNADEARQIIEEQRKEIQGRTPCNLEEQAISMVGRDIFEKLIKGYTEKQWGRPCRELPADIIRRIPVRFEADNNYFDDTYQGIPIGGYNPLINALLEGIEVRTECDFIVHRSELATIANHILYTGPIDRFFDYCAGELEYRSLRFDHERLEQADFQGVAVMNFTDSEVPYTRIIEHKHFEHAPSPHTIITREYPATWSRKCEPYYPINNARNTALYEEYRRIAHALPNISFGGRLGEYRYMDMDDVVEAALAYQL